MRRTVVLLTCALISCSRATPAQRAAEVASWLDASGGILDSWVRGAVPAEGADSNLEATEKMIRDEIAGTDPGPLIEKLQRAGRAVAEARAIVRAGNTSAAPSKRAQLGHLARELRQEGTP